MKGGDADLSRTLWDGSKKYTFLSFILLWRQKRKKEAQQSSKTQRQIGSGSAKDVLTPLNLLEHRYLDVAVLELPEERSF